MYQSSAPKNKLQQALHDTGRQAINDEQDNISYGIISAVNQENGQVKVKRLLADGKVGGEISRSFLPLATPLSDLFLRFGALREGLVVRIYWKGKLSLRNAIIEVIGDEEHSLLNKVPYKNEIAVGPYRIFGGSMI